MELRSHHQPEEFRKGQKEMSCILPPPSILLTSFHLGWAMRAPPGRMLNQNDLAKENLETNPITIKPTTGSHVADLFSWVLLNFCSLPGHPFPIQYVALSARATPCITHSWMLDKSPLLGPGSSAPSCNSMACPFVACWSIGRRRHKWPGGRCTSKFKGILAVSSYRKVSLQSRN